MNPFSNRNIINLGNIMDFVIGVHVDHEGIGGRRHVYTGAQQRKLLGAPLVKNVGESLVSIK